MTQKHTPGPWPHSLSGDGKRIVVGDGLVEGPNGYEVAEVYSDDCDLQTAFANARLIAAAPELLAAIDRYLAARKALEAAPTHNGPAFDAAMAEHDAALADLTAASAKAKGEQP